jgi:two-component system, OmpR family, response regulator
MVFNERGGHRIAPDAAQRPRHPIPACNREEVQILVAGTPSATRMMLVSYLQECSMSVTSASNKQELSHHVAARPPTLIVLDTEFGHDDGLSSLREIRSYSDAPIIIVASPGSNVADRIAALEFGADDCVNSPFGFRELLARIHAVLRGRGAGRALARHSVAYGVCRFGGWRLDRGARTLTDPDGTPVVLTRREYALLITFVAAPHRPLSREYLLRAMRMHEDIYDRSIDVQVLRLRRKLEIDPRAPRIIQTERGIGYVFALAVEQ